MTRASGRTGVRPTGNHLRRWVTRGAHEPGFAPGRGPIAVADVELSFPLPPQLAPLIGAEDVELLLRLHGEPLALVREHVDTGLAERVLSQAGGALRATIAAHLSGDGAHGADHATLTSSACRQLPSSEGPLVSVVIPTVGRPVLLERCVRSVLASTYSSLELLVVDNVASRETALLVERLAGADPRVRYLCEPRPGASRARNAGIHHARGDLIAFTDDDVVVDPAWLAALVRGFSRRADVVCVTGLTLAAALETPAQLAFEDYAAWPRGFAPQLFDLHRHRADTVLYPWTAGVFGASNNAAVRREALLSLGGFEVRMGPATPTFGGEDLDLLLALVLAGGAVAFEPTALVRHLHRREVADLHWQVFTYGVGMTALLTRWLLRDRRLLRDLVRQAPRLATGLLHPVRSGRSDAGTVDAALRRRLRLLELLGYLYGPVAWWRASRLEAADRLTDEPTGR